MVFFWMVMAVLALECLLSWWWLARLRRLLHGQGRLRFVRWAAGVAMACIACSMAWFVASRLGVLPKVRALTALGMVWVVLAVPFGVVPCLLAFGVADIAARWWSLRRRQGQAQAAHVSAGPTRRQLLAAGLAASPIALTYAAAGVGVAQAWNFRVRRLAVPVPGLPPALAGLRIAHVSDTHVGGFTPSENLAAVADAVAQEKPDLIVFTGDLVDHSNAHLPAALDFCERLRAIAPLFLCEGNHDRIDNAEVFRRSLRAAGLDLLVDGDARTLDLRGARVQVLGANWSHRDHAAAVAQAARKREAGAFPILLIHHPDAFDAAADAGFPLVLAGHSHGGQLMLTERLGAGPVVCNYWSGLYRKPAASLVVSNGVGHWFPLRVNAPAEIGVLELAAG